MFKQIINSLIPELVTIEAKTQLALKKSGGFALSSNKLLQKSERRLWMPALCLVAAKTAKEINAKVLQLAGIIHLFNYASYLHLILPEEPKTDNLKEELQYPILVGDMLYSQVCADLCRYGLQQYLDPITSLIADVHRELVRRDIKMKQNQTVIENELELNAIISEGACYLGSHAVVGNSHLTSTLRSLGYNLGLINAAFEKNLTFDSYKDNWCKVQLCMEMLPPGEGKDMFKELVLNPDSEWEQDGPVLLKKKKA